MSAVRKTKSRASHLRVVKGSKTNPLQSIVESTWAFMHAALWQNEEFTEAEQMQFHKLIAEYYNSAAPAEKVFEELVERVCLVKRYLSRKQGRYVAKPIDWLNIHYYNGLRGTETWYRQVCQQRVTVPYYNQGLTMLAKALMKYLQEPNAHTLQIVRIRFIAERQFDLLQIFNNTIVQLQINQL